jgi:hypothetical protein
MMKFTHFAILLIVLLSLATWIFFFWWHKIPLRVDDTIIVVGFWGLVVLLGRWIRQRFTSKG